MDLVWPSKFTTYNWLLYFDANTNKKDMKFWVTDGINTHKVQDVDSLYEDTFDDIGDMKVWKGKMYFCTSDGVENYRLFEFETTVKD